MAMNVLVLNGPNLDALGSREPDVYGSSTLAEIEADLAPVAADLDITLSWRQAVSEAALIEHLQAAAGTTDGALLNAGALTHYGYALHDAIRVFGAPVIEVHLSNVHAREAWRQRSVIASACVAGVYGFGADVYRVALVGLAGRLAP